MQPDAERVRSGPLGVGVARVAVGVRYHRHRDQWHTAVAYCTDEGEARCLHLAFDLELRDVSLDDERLGWSLHYAWVELALPKERLRVLAQLCRRVARQVAAEGQGVRYSVRHHLGRFDAETGRYVPAAGERGLTCATCVLALCRGAAVELVAIASWPERDEDRPWIDRVVRALRRRDSDHADAVASDGLCARFRPTEVAGACLAPALPVGFDDAVALAQTLRDRYDEIFPEGDDL